MLEITITNQHFISKHLEKATQRIQKLSSTIGNNLFAIAWIISETADEMAQEIENADGFTNVHEWTEKAFGFKKSMSYNLLNVGRRFTAKVTNGKITTYRDNITSPNENGYSISQCIQFLPYVDDDVEQAHQAGIITPEMSCKQISETLKKHLKAPKTETETETETEEVYTTVYNEHEGIYVTLPQKVWDKLVTKYGGE